MMSLHAVKLDLGTTDVPRTGRRRVPRWVAVAATALALLLGTVAVRQLRSAVPAVERRALLIDRVERGTLLRQVEGPGTLMPIEMRWATALSAGRVDRILARPGAVVRAHTVLVELENSDVRLAALEAEQQLAGARAELVHLSAALEEQRLGQEAAVVGLEAELADARGRADVDERLGSGGFIAEVDRQRSQRTAGERAARLALERQRLGALRRGLSAQLLAQQAQIDRLAVIAEFRRRQLDALHVRATVDGVLQELPLETGQWVTPGTLLAKVAPPDQLKAVLRIAEVQAKDLARGQSATVDTRNGIVAGHVSRVDPVVQGGTVKVEIALDGPLPSGARPDLTVEGTILLERLDGVLHVGRPALGQAHTRVSLFRLSADGREATRVKVALGRTSARRIEIESGAQEGDQLILSDASEWERFDRIELH
jgi:multidrug efflux pump subunit AcrA (membrane-fusion protein)